MTFTDTKKKKKQECLDGTVKGITIDSEETKKVSSHYTKQEIIKTDFQ